MCVIFLAERTNFKAFIFMSLYNSVYVCCNAVFGTVFI